MSSFFKKLKFLFSSSAEFPTDSRNTQQPLVPPTEPTPAPTVSEQPLTPHPQPALAPEPTVLDQPLAPQSQPAFVLEPTISEQPLVPQPQPATPKPSPELLALLEAFKKDVLLVQLTPSLDALLHTSPLDSVQTTTFIQSVDATIQNLSTQITQLQKQLDSSTASPLSPLLTLTKKISQTPIDSEAITHENFLSHPQFPLLQTHLKFCQELGTHAQTLNFAPENLTQIEELVKVGVAILEKINALTPTITSFKGTEQALRDEIVSFGDIIAKLQSQPGLSADWNGKKDALTQKREELAQRRAAYEADEAKINQAIGVVTQNIPIILQKLQPLANSLLPLIETTHTQNLSSTDTTTLTTQLSQYKQTLDLLNHCKHVIYS